MKALFGIVAATAAITFALPQYQAAAGNNGAVAAGVVGGLAAGAIIGSAAASHHRTYVETNGYARDCRTIVTHRINRYGERVTVRRRACD